MWPGLATMTEVSEAADRLEDFLARLDRLDLEDLRLLSLPLPYPDERRALHAEIMRQADAVGRRAMVEDARARAREAIISAYTNHQYDPTWIALNWARSLGTTKDRLGLILAAEDAAVAAVLGDVLDEDLAAELSERFEQAAGMEGSTISPSLAVWRRDRSGLLGRIIFLLTIALFAVSVLLAELPGVLVGSLVLLVLVVIFWRRRQVV
jgi:hypothetical protein